jgi:hypothetical protein
MKQPKELLNTTRFTTPTTKHEHKFQEICEDLARDFGKAVWRLPYEPWCDEFKLRKAGEIARKRGVLKFSYLVGIIKKL